MFVHCMIELIVKYKVATYHYTELRRVIAKALSIKISNLQFTTNKRAISIGFKLILNIISMKDFYIWLLAIC